MALWDKTGFIYINKHLNSNIIIISLDSSWNSEVNNIAVV